MIGVSYSLGFCNYCLIHKVNSKKSKGPFAINISMTYLSEWRSIRFFTIHFTLYMIHYLLHHHLAAVSDVDATSGVLHHATREIVVSTILLFASNLWCINACCIFLKCDTLHVE